MKKHNLSLLIAGLFIASIMIVIVAIKTKSAAIPMSNSAANSTSNAVRQKPSTDTLEKNRVSSDSSLITLSFTKLEIATTRQQREQGLQNRKDLCDECGVLFVFEQSQPLSFWMKNTSIPLDLIFVDSEGVIVTIHKNTTPYQLDPTYSSSVNSLYALEVNAGFSDKKSLQVGTKLDIKSMIKQGTSFD